MKKHLFYLNLGVILLSSNSAYAVSFNPFVSSTGGSPIGFTYAGNKFVGSNYFNNQLYQTDLSGNNLQLFGAAIPISSGAIGEITLSSSLGLGGFGNQTTRDIFAGSEAAGNIYKFSNDGGSQTLFTSGLNGGVRGIGFDPYGKYGNDMIVTTRTGNVYEVDHTGHASLLANVGGDAEGVSFASQAFGNIAAGSLFVLSEGTGRIKAIDPNGNQTDLGLQFSTPEMLSFVPSNLGQSGNPLEGFYAANYTVNVVKADASDFASFKGDAVLTDENNHSLYHLYWDGSKFVSTIIGQFPNQPEDGIFVTSTILNPVPEPEQLALLLTGLPLINLVSKRSKQK